MPRKTKFNAHIVQMLYNESPNHVYRTGFTVAVSQNGLERLADPAV